MGYVVISITKITLAKKSKCIQKEVNTNYELAAHYILLKIIQIQYDLR